MGKSKAFAGIRGDVVEIVASIPKGRVCSYRAIGEYLGVMPRHVAYLIATDPAFQALPWHRVVDGDGFVTKRTPNPRHLDQIDRLLAEEVLLEFGRVADFGRRFIAPGDLVPWGPKVERYDAS